MNFIRRARVFFFSPTIHVLVGESVAKLVMLLANVLLVRYLPVSNYASYAVLSNAVFLGFQLACAPVTRLYIAEHDRYQLVAPRLLFLLSAVVVPLVCFFMAPGQGWFGFLMIAVGVMLLSAFQFLRIRLQHANLFLHYSIAEVARNVAWVVMVVSALYLVPKEAFWGELALGLLVVASLIVVLAFRWIMPSEKHVIDDRNWLPDLYPSLHAARYVIAYTLVAAIVPFVPFAVVTWFLDDLAVSTYGAAMRYVGVISLIGLAVNTVLLPSMASLTGGEEALAKFVGVFTRRFLLLMPVLIGVVVLVSWVLPVIDGGKYQDIKSVFTLLALVQIVSLYAAPFTNALLIQHKSVEILYAMLLGLCACVVVIACLAEYAWLPMIIVPAVGSMVGYVVIASFVTRAFLGSRKAG